MGAGMADEIGEHEDGQEGRGTKKTAEGVMMEHRQMSERGICDVKLNYN